MAQPKFTPGPWRVVVGVCKNDHPDTSADVVGEGEIHVANCGCRDDAKANARLISAAPELRAALRGLLSNPNVRIALDLDRLREYDAALAKAEGRDGK